MDDEIKENDESIQLLDRFMDYTGAWEAITGSGDSMVHNAVVQMLEIFNSFAMVAVGIIILYMWAVAVMHTAHEGVPLGKRYSTLWTPIRTVMAVVFIAPFPGLGGLSILQAMILGVVGLSITGGNMLYERQLEFFANNEASLMPLATHSSSPDANLVAKMMESLICVENHNENRNLLMQALDTANVTGTTFYEPKTINWDAKKGQIRFGGIHNAFLYGKQCGGITFSCPTDRNGSSYADLCFAERDGALDMLRALEPIAKDIYHGRLPSDNPGRDARLIQGAIDAYRQRWEMAATNREGIEKDEETGLFVITLTDEHQDRVDQWVEYAKKGGWITAGQWYWTIAASSMEQQNLSRSSVEMTAIRTELVEEAEEVFFVRREVAMDMLASIEIDYGGGREAFTRPVTGREDENASVFGYVGEGWKSAIGSSGHARIEYILKDGDPVRALASYGQWMIGLGMTVVAVSGGMVALAEGANANLLGMAGNTFTGIPAALGAILKWAASFLTVIAGILIGMGGMLAYYLPAVPMIFWGLAILGWMILIIESLLAAPLWAASHAVPEGEGFAGRYALQGWQLFLNVALRPILLTIGLLISMFVMQGIIFFTLKGYAIFNEAMVSSTADIAIMGFVFTNLIMVMLTIVLAHKAHEVIYDTADNVMKWIGFGVTPLGTVKSEGEVKGMMRGASGNTERFAGAALGKAGSGRREAKDPTQRPTHPNSTADGGPANQAGGTPMTQGGGGNDKDRRR